MCVCVCVCAHVCVCACMCVCEHYSLHLQLLCSCSFNCVLFNLLDTMRHYRGFAGPPRLPLSWLYTCPTASLANANERAL